MSKKLNEYAAFVLALRDHFATACVGIGGRVAPTSDSDNRKAIECADKLRRLAMAYATHHERECSDSQYVNVEWIGLDNRTSSEVTAERLNDRRDKLAAEYGLSLGVYSDPRGYALRVMGLGVWNTWGGEEGGFGVPED